MNDELDIHIVVAGDFCPNGRVAALLDKKSATNVFETVKSFTEDADFSILNFECPIVKGNYPEIEKVGPHLKTIPYSMEMIKDAGFRMVTLANNHILDYGEQGVRDTINQCVESGVDYVGAGNNLNEACSIKYVTIKGKKIAIVNCCEHEFSIATETSAGANPLNPIRQYYEIREASSKSDYVIVIIHGGHEYCQYPSTRMIECYRFFIDCGADAVVNHHQHCYSGFEYYKGHPIVYGVGNLCFDRKDCRNSNWNEGYLAEIVFRESNTSIKCHPYIQCDVEPKVIMLDVCDSFNKKIEHLNRIIKDPKRLRKEIEKFYHNNSASYSFAFEPYSGKIATKLFLLGLLPSFFNKTKKRLIKNYHMCESHSDIIDYVLNH